MLPIFCPVKSKFVESNVPVVPICQPAAVPVGKNWSIAGPIFIKGVAKPVSV